ncbi:hypothetical protein D3C80_1660390 [compost metagenome]
MISSSRECTTSAWVVMCGMRFFTAATNRCSSRIQTPDMLNSPALLLSPAFICRSTIARRRSSLMPKGDFSLKRHRCTPNGIAISNGVSIAALGMFQPS